MRSSIRPYSCWVSRARDGAAEHAAQSAAKREVVQSVRSGEDGMAGRTGGGSGERGGVKPCGLGLGLTKPITGAAFAPNGVAGGLTAPDSGAGG